MIGIDEVALKALRVCDERRWSRDWSRGGCYLHLEVSEFIESLRGKGSDSPSEEGADVLFVLLSMLSARGIAPSDVLGLLDQKCDRYLADPEYRSRTNDPALENGDPLAVSTPSGEGVGRP